MSAFKEARYHTLELLSRLDEGAIDPKYLAELLLNYMSDFEVQKFMELNEMVDFDLEEA